MTTKRLFFALWPDDRQRDRLRDIISPMAKLVEGSAVDRRDWHVTLAYIGDFEERRIPELHEHAAAIMVEPFELHFNRLEFWPRPKIATLVTATVPHAVERLVGALNSVLVDQGVVPEERAYRPHITVVRRARPFETQRLAHPSGIEWTGFELVESVSQHGGVTYRPLKQ